MSRNSWVKSNFSSIRSSTIRRVIFIDFSLRVVLSLFSLVHRQAMSTTQSSVTSRCVDRERYASKIWSPRRPCRTRECNTSTLSTLQHEGGIATSNQGAQTAGSTTATLCCSSRLGVVHRLVVQRRMNCASPKLSVQNANDAQLHERRH